MASDTSTTRQVGGRSSNRLPARTRLTLVLLSVGVGAYGLLQSLIVPVLTQVQDHFDTSQSTAAWVLTAYLLSGAVATPLIGRLGDAVGKQRMLIITLLLLAGGSFLAAFAPTIEWLLFARVVQGVGGGVVPLAFGIIRDEVPPLKAGPAVGAVASLTAAAFGVGLVLAGPIVDVLGYEWLFLLPAIATTIAALGTVLAVPESPVRMPGRIAVLPAVLLSGWLVCLLLAFSEGSRMGWTSPVIIGLSAATVVLFVGWMWSEDRAAVPLIDLDLMRVRGVWTSNLVVLLVGFGMFGALGFLPQMLQTPTSSGYGFGSTITQTGHVLAPMTVFSFAMGIVAPHLVHRFGARPVVLVATLCSATAYGLIALFHDQLWQVTLWFCIQGIGSGLVVSSLAGVVLASVRPDQSGVASGMNANIRMIGGSIGSAMMASVITARLGADGFPLEVGYRAGFLVLSAAMLLAAGASLLIPATRRVR